MKKIVSLLLCAALLAAFVPAVFAADASTKGAYKHVVIVGIDGAGRFVEQADTPEFDRIFKNGALTYTARTETKTDSAPNWGSMLMGVSYFATGMENGDTDENTRTSDTQYPTIFTYLRKAHPDAELASYVNWSNINKGIIETDIGVNKVNIGNDGELTDAICEYFDAGNKPSLFFVQFDSIDGAGHSKGSNSEEYFNQINIVDGYIGRIYDCLENNGLAGDTLFIVVADHGHTPIGGHGGITMRESQVTLAVAGKTVVKGGRIGDNARNRDVAAMALYALGEERPDYFTSIVPSGVFGDVEGESRPLFKDAADTVLGSLAWFITLLTSVIGL